MFDKLLAPAIQYARDGLAGFRTHRPRWCLPNALPLRGCRTKLDPDSVNTWYIDGKPLRDGRIFCKRSSPHSFRLLAKYGRDVFYRGKIARAIVAKSRKLGG